MNIAEILPQEEAISIIKRCSVWISLIFTFILGSYKGNIALWRDAGEDPVKVFPYSVSALPPADQAALENGIRIESETDLIRLLEDYLS